MQFIRFSQRDPDYGNAGLSNEVIVQVGQIVKIEPRWSQVTEDGKKYQKYVGPDDDSDALNADVHREYFIYDSLGNQYSSDDATTDGRQIISDWYKSAK